MTHNWRLTLSCVAAFSIFFFIVWLLKAQNFETSGGSEVKNDYSYGKAVKDPFVWKFALGFGAFLFLYVMTLTSLPPTLANTYSNFKKEIVSKCNRIVDLGNTNFRTPVQLYHILLFKFA